MKKFLFASLLFTFCLLTVNGQKVYSNQIIVKLKKEYNSNGKGIDDAQKVTNVSKSFSAKRIKKIVLNSKENLFLYTIGFPEGTDFNQVIKEYEKTGEIEYAEPNYEIKAPEPVAFVPDNLLFPPKQPYSYSKVLVTVNDPYYYKQWGLKNNTTAGADINIEGAWDIQKGSNNIIVAILDTGIKMDHPELAGRIWENSSEISGVPNFDDDGNNYKDDFYGWNFGDDNNNPVDDIAKFKGHGTRIAGIIGANTNNSVGFAGVDWNCKIMNLRIYNSQGNTSYDIMASAIGYALDKGAKVINISSASEGYSLAIRDAIANAISNGILFVISIGNYNDGSKYYFPSAFSNCTYFPTTCNGVMAIGATDANDKRWVNSNYGNYISVMAPGKDIYGLSNASTDTYNTTDSGTSFSTPYVTGLASLLFAQDPTRTPVQIKDIIQSTADKVGDVAYDSNGWNQYYGYGRINATAALSKLLSTEDISSQADAIKVYPNPAPHQFYCNYPEGTKKVDIFSSLGQLITSKNVEGSDTQSFYLSEPGIYFVQFTLKDNKKINKKIIIVK